MDKNPKIPSKMVLPPAPPRQQRQSSNHIYYQELASDFVEQVVGRQRWRENLAAMVREKNLKPSLERWLQTMNIRAKPENVLQGLSDLLKRTTHGWK